MVPKRMLDNVIQEITRISGLASALWDEEGNLLSSTAGEIQDLPTALEGEWQFFPVPEEEPVYKIGILARNFNENEKAEGTLLSAEKTDAFSGDETVALKSTMAGEFGRSQIMSLFKVYGYRMGREYFAQKLLQGELSDREVAETAKHLHSRIELARAAILIKPEEAEKCDVVAEALKSFYIHENEMLIGRLEGESVAVFLPAVDREESITVAEGLFEMLQAELMVPVRIAISNVHGKLLDAPDAYKEALLSMEVGETFYPQQKVLHYGSLGIGRLLNRIPEDLSDLFLEEIFGGHRENALTEEEQQTLRVYFANNLNHSETARQLYIHRNTLTYRLEKIAGKTGLDVRVFDDAVTMKIAMMVDRRQIRKPEMS